MDKVNIDELVNYKEEYTKFVQKPEFKHDRMVSLCPFHDDRKPSFSVDLKTGKFVCFACGKAGNYVSFRAELDGTSNADAYKKILREHGVDETKKEPAKPKSYTVEDYAAEKKLPAEWLHMVCSLESKQEQDPLRQNPVLQHRKQGPGHPQAHGKPQLQVGVWISRKDDSIRPLA